MTPDGETLAQARARFWLDIRHPWTRHSESRDRLGWKDLLGGHALVNIAVTWCREDYHAAGHAIVYSVPVVVAALVLALWL